MLKLWRHIRSEYMCMGQFDQPFSSYFTEYNDDGHDTIIMSIPLTRHLSESNCARDQSAAIRFGRACPFSSSSSEGAALIVGS